MGAKYVMKRFSRKCGHQSSRIISSSMKSRRNLTAFLHLNSLLEIYENYSRANHLHLLRETAVSAT